MRIVFLLFLVALSCKKHVEENNMFGQWCYSDINSDFSVNLFDRDDTLFLKYSYVFDRGNRINATVNSFSGFIPSNKIKNNQVIIPVVDEYEKATSSGIGAKTLFDIKLSYNENNSTLTWEDTSKERSNYLPYKIRLKHCKESN